MNTVLWRMWAAALLGLLALGVQWSQSTAIGASTWAQVPEESEESGQFGLQVVGISNLAGNGRPGVVIAAPGGAGKRPGVVRAFAAVDGSPVWSVFGGGLETGLGWRLTALGDIDGDGVGDIAACCLKDEADAELWLLSGKSGRTIRVLKGSGRQFGMLACGLPDTNKDGTPDVALWGAVPRNPDNVARNGILVYSGKNGEFLRELKVEGGGGCPCPDAMVRTGDVDGGGVADLALSTGSTVAILSMESGALVRKFQVDSEPEELTLLAQTGDAGKEAGDLYVACAAGAVRILRVPLNTGQQRAFVEPEEGASEGRARAMAWIRRKEGAGFLVAGLPACSVGGESSAGKVAAFNGVDGKTAYVVESPTGYSQFGRSLATVDDVDGDGVEELIVGAPLFSPGPREADRARGRVYLLSGRTGAILLALGPRGREELGGKTVGR